MAKERKGLEAGIVLKAFLINVIFAAGYEEYATRVRFRLIPGIW